MDVETLTIVTPAGEETVEGEILSEASSRTTRHRHPPGSWPKPYQRCSACRWTDLVLFRCGDGYAVVSEGVSIIRGEMNYARVRRVKTAEQMVDSLYREDTRSGEPSKPVLSIVGRRALMRAAEHDREVAQVLADRGIVS